MSNNYTPLLTDQEVLTIYFYGLRVENRRGIKDIYDFSDNYLRSWFPELGATYEAFLTRLNKLSSVFAPLLFMIIEEEFETKQNTELLVFAQQMISVVDSMPIVVMPIVVAKVARSYSAKVAFVICDRGYCASKKMTYYGLKLHILAFARKLKLPIAEYIELTPASFNDLTVCKPVFEKLLTGQFMPIRFMLKKNFKNGYSKIIILKS
jgi:hypothetical protein